MTAKKPAPEMQGTTAHWLRLLLPTKYEDQFRSTPDLRPDRPPYVLTTADGQTLLFPTMAGLVEHLDWSPERISYYLKNRNGLLPDGSHVRRTTPEEFLKLYNSR